jgi:hypothetical protein
MMFLTAMEADHVALNYLGKGFDITKYDAFGDTQSAVLNELLAPDHKDFLEFQKIFKRTTNVREVHFHYIKHQERIAILEAMGPLRVDIEIEANWENTYTRHHKSKYEVDEMHTSTLKFRPYIVQRIPELLKIEENEEDSDSETESNSSEMFAEPIEQVHNWPKKTITSLREPTSSRTISLKDNLAKSLLNANALHEKLSLLSNQQLKRKLEDPKFDKNKFLLSTSKKLLNTERVSGATHFVSGVHLGARIVKNTTTEEVETVKEKTVSGGVAAKCIGIKFGQVGHQRTTYEKSFKNMLELKGPGVNLTSEGKLPTTITKDQEVVIGLELSPITELVPFMWRGPLQSACIRRLIAQKMKKPVTPGKAPNIPYLLKAGKHWLKAEGKEIKATDEKEEASYFYIIPNSESPDFFYIEHRTSENILWYVSAESKKNGNVWLEKGSQHDKCLFEVAWVHDCKQAKLSDWSIKPLLIRRAKLGLLEFTKTCLSVPTTKGRRVTCSEDHSSDGGETQIGIIHAPRIALTMEKD